LRYYFIRAYEEETRKPLRVSSFHDYLSTTSSLIDRANRLVLLVHSRRHPGRRLRCARACSRSGLRGTCGDRGGTSADRDSQ